MLADIDSIYSSGTRSAEQIIKESKNINPICDSKTPKRQNDHCR